MSRPRRLRRITIGITATIAFVSIALIALLASRGPASAIPFQSPMIGQEAPKLRATNLSGGALSTNDEVPLTPIGGRPLVVNFFASWCAPCKAEAPELNAFSYDQSLKTNGARLVGVVFNDADSAARAFARGEGILYEFAADSGGTIASAYGVTSPPTTFLINTSGKVVEAWIGPITASQLDKAVVSKGYSS